MKELHPAVSFKHIDLMRAGLKILTNALSFSGPK